jgi:hypothetical protein
MNFNHILINEDYVTLDIGLISYGIMDFHLHKSSVD